MRGLGRGRNGRGRGTREGRGDKGDLGGGGQVGISSKFPTRV